MKIKLLVDLPIDHKHGATKGRVFELLKTDGPQRRPQDKFWFIGDAREWCAALGYEC